SRTWIGHLGDTGTYRVIITQSEAATHGRIATPAGEFLIETNAYGQWLYDVSRAGLHRAMPSEPTDGLLPSVTERVKVASAASLTKVAAATSIIDVMVVYT